jgi:hypothetical protein
MATKPLGQRAQVAIGQGRFRVELKSLVQVGYGVVELTLFIVGTSLRTARKQHDYWKTISERPKRESRRKA